MLFGNETSNLEVNATTDPDDYFYITVPSYSQITVQINWVAIVDLNLYAYDASRNQLVASEACGIRGIAIP